MIISPNNPLYERLHKMAMTPRTQLKQLANGSLVSLLAMIGLVFTSELENPGVFYGLTAVLVLAIAYAIPGYIGIWVWRMRDVLFPKDSLK